MRILYVCNEYPPVPHGGIGSVTETLARGVVEAGDEAVVAGFDPGRRRSRWTTDGMVDVYRIAPNYPRGMKLRRGAKQWSLDPLAARRYFSSRLDRLIKVVRPDLIESHDWSGPLWQHPGYPLVVRLHGCSLAHAARTTGRGGRLTHYFERRNLRMADALAAVSHHIGDRTLDAAGMRGRSFHTIYNGVDTRVFRVGAGKRSRTEVLFAGALRTRKGLGEIFAALPLIAQYYPKARFHFVGSLPAGGEGRRLRALRAGLPAEVRECVRFSGALPREQMPAVYSRAAVAVFASLSEAFGMACAEAMACETPVVMTSLDSGPELVSHGESGLLANPSRPGELAAAVIRLLWNSPLRRDLGVAGRRRVESVFNAETLVARNLDFYRSVIREKQSKWRAAA